MTFAYEGDRNRDDIVAFAKRLLGKFAVVYRVERLHFIYIREFSAVVHYFTFNVYEIGPPVSQISSQYDFEEAKENSEIFFLFAGEEEGPLWNSYLKVKLFKNAGDINLLMKSFNVTFSQTMKHNGIFHFRFPVPINNMNFSTDLRQN